MKNSLVIGGIVIAILIGVAGLLKEPAQEIVSVGGVASPDIASPYFSFGDVRHWGANSVDLNTASTTACSIQNPSAGTSTLAFAGIRFDTATTSSLYVELGKADSAFATTTSLGTATLQANASGAVVTATDNEGGLDGAHVFGANDYLVVNVASAEGATGYGNFAPTGTCKATWVQN